MNITKRYKAVKKDCSNIITPFDYYTDADGIRAFYFIPNPYDEFGLFTDKPKDAIECIKNGLADCILKTIQFGSVMKEPIRFVDREYGEKIRQKTLEAWKDTKFAYGVKYSYTDSFSNGRFVMKNKSLMNIDDNMQDVLSFDNEEDATLFINEVNEEVNKYYEEYNSLKKTEDQDWDDEHTFKPFFNSIKSKIGSDSVYYNAFIHGLYEKKYNKSKYTMEVVQIVKAD